MTRNEYNCDVAVSIHYEYNRVMSKKVDPLAFRPDPDVRAALDRDAAEQERSLSWVINRILRDHYKLPKPSKPRPAKGKPAG